MLPKDAVTVWNNIKGVICVYKPADIKTNRIRETVIYRICKDLNKLDCRPNSPYVSIEGNPSEKLSVNVKPNLADDVLSVGERYQPSDLPCAWSNYLGTNTSGVLILGLKLGTKIAKNLRENRPMRAYRVKGTFGTATDNFYKDGTVVERTSFKHIKLGNVEKLLAYMQAAHQKKMFELCGVDIKSQAAYEIAFEGLIRPANSKTPLIYGIKCVEFEPPNFTIEIQCVNEYETYLKSLIQEIGMKLNSSAHCTGLQCIRHGYFGLENSLLRHQWDLKHVLKNLDECAKIMNK